MVFNGFLDVFRLYYTVFFKRFFDGFPSSMFVLAWTSFGWSQKSSGKVRLLDGQVSSNEKRMAWGSIGNQPIKQPTTNPFGGNRTIFKPQKLWQALQQPLYWDSESSRRGQWSCWGVFSAQRSSEVFFFKGPSFEYTKQCGVVRAHKESSSFSGRKCLFSLITTVL